MFSLERVSKWGCLENYVFASFAYDAPVKQPMYPYAKNLQPPSFSASDPAQIQTPWARRPKCRHRARVYLQVSLVVTVSGRLGPEPDKSWPLFWSLLRLWG